MSAVPVRMNAHAQPTPALADQPSASPPLRVEIIALTSNDALLEQIGQALDGESTIRQADSLDAAREFIRPLRACVLLLEAHGHPDIAEIIEDLQSPDGTCIVVVFSPSDEIANVSNALRGSPTFAILPVPVEQAQTMAVLEGAREEALARLTLASQSTATAVASHESSDTFGDPDVVACALDVLGRPRFSCTSFIGERHRRLRKAAATGEPGRSVWLGLAIVAIIVGWFTLRAPDSDDRTQAAGSPCRSRCRARQPAVDGRRGRGPGGFQR